MHLLLLIQRHPSLNLPACNHDEEVSFETAHHLGHLLESLETRVTSMNHPSLPERCFVWWSVPLRAWTYSIQPRFHVQYRLDHACHGIDIPNCWVSEIAFWHLTWWHLFGTDVVHFFGSFGGKFDLILFLLNPRRMIIYVM